LSHSLKLQAPNHKLQTSTNDQNYKQWMRFFGLRPQNDNKVVSLQVDKCPYSLLSTLYSLLSTLYSLLFALCPTDTCTYEVRVSLLYYASVHKTGALVTGALVLFFMIASFLFAVGDETLTQNDVLHLLSFQLSKEHYPG